MLSDTDRKILAELDKNCRIPIPQLAEMLNESRQVVEYRIKSMVRDGIILSFNTSFNPHRFGLKVYKIYLKIRNIPEERQKLLQKIKSSRLVWWASECSGSWDIIIAIFSHSDGEIFRYKNELISQFSKIIVDIYGDALVTVDQFPKMYFTNKVVAPVLFAGEIVNNQLDDLEYRIMEETVNNGRIKLAQLSRRLRTSITKLRGKIRRLEDLGIIVQYRVGVDLNKLGYQLYKTIISVDRFDSKDEEALGLYLRKLPNIHYYSRNIWHVELELVVRNFQEYSIIIEDLKQSFPYLVRTVDTVLMNTDEWTPGFTNWLKAGRKSRRSAAELSGQYEV